MIDALVAARWLAPLLIALGLVVVVLLDSRRTRRRALGELRASWSAAAAREGDPRSARRLFDASTPTGCDVFVLDERTWSDLDLDEVVRRLDHSVSPVGSQALYRMVRATRLAEAPIVERRELVDELVRDAALRDRLFLVLHPLHHPRAGRVVDLAWGEIPAPPKWTAVAPLLALGATAVVALAWLGVTSWGWLVPMFLLASLAHFAHQRCIASLPLAGSAALLGAARAIARGGDRRLTHLFPELEGDVARITPLLRRLGPLVLEDSLGLLQYVKIYWLVDVVAYRRSYRELVARRGELQRLLDAVGSLDALLGVAAFLAARHDTCRPQLALQHDRWTIRDVRHPLLEHAVGNDFLPGERGALITGSNMAGKTTFLKTLGVNAVLAQSLGFAIAAQWSMPPVRVLSSIGRADNLISGRSYYMAEVESILRLVRAADADDIHLLLADEVFRGTNPDERVAGAVAVLNYLSRGRHIVLAATHDLELVAELAERYDTYHFAETLAAEGLIFDFTLRSGPCSSRNAIALLAQVGYPEEVVERARQRSGKQG